MQQRILSNPLPPDIGMPEKRGGRSGGSNHKEKQFLRHARRVDRDERRRNLLVNVPRTFHPTSSREPAEMLLSPSGVDSSLYQPSPFHRAQHATCARTLPRYLRVIVLWLPPYPNPYSKFGLRPRSSLEPSFTHAASSYGFEPAHSPTMQPSILRLQVLPISASLK